MALCNTNFLQPSGFTVSIDRENYPTVEYFSKAVTLPSVDVNAADIGIRRAVMPSAGDTVTFGTLDFDVAVDEDLNAYNEMYQWMERLVNEKQITKKEAIESGSIATEADITVGILSSHNNVNRRFKFYNCVPISISGFEMNTEAGAETPLVFTTSFRFLQFELI